MSEYVIIFQVLAALVALFFIFLTYMNTKTWRWLHVTMTFFVFGAAVAFCFYAAMALKTRAAWIKLHADLEKERVLTAQKVAAALAEPRAAAARLREPGAARHGDERSCRRRAGHSLSHQRSGAGLAPLILSLEQHPGR